MDDPDYQGFWEALPHVAVLARKKDVLDAFRHKHREEILGLMSMLHRIGLVGSATQLHPAPPEECDECSAPLLDHQWFIDGKTAHGGWSAMCPRCFLEEGHSIGWGAGQLYLQIEDDNWRLVSGGSPDGRDEGDQNER